MKALFFSIPLFGHVNYGLKIAKALIDGAHQVRYYSGDSFKKYITAKGVDFCPYCPEIEVLFEDQDSSYSAEYMRSVNPEDIDYVSEIYRYSYHLYEINRLIRTYQMDEIRAFKPDLIVYDSACVWGRKIARVLGIPCVCSCTPYSFPDGLVTEDPSLFAELVLHQQMSPGVTLRTIKRLNSLLKKQMGLDEEFPLSENWSGHGDINLIYSVRDFQLGSKFFDEEKDRFCGILIDEDDVADIDDLIVGNGDPNVYISFGTIYNSKKLFEELTRELRAVSGINFLLNIGKSNDPKEFSDLPSNWKIVSRVPQVSLMKRLDAFITHGGVNSVREAAHFGVPMVAVPWEGDTLCTGKDIADGKYGISIRPDEMYRIKDALFEVLGSEEIKRNCKELSTKMQSAGGLDRVVRIIENI